MKVSLPGMGNTNFLVPLAKPLPALHTRIRSRTHHTQNIFAASTHLWNILQESQYFCSILQKFNKKYTFIYHF